MGKKISTKTKTPSTLADYPEIAKEWHPSKNGSLRPELVKPKSDKKAWFICSKGSKEDL